MFTPTHGIMTFQRWITAACMFCMLGITGCANYSGDLNFRGDAAYNKGDYAEAINIYMPLAAQGNAHSQAMLGGMYYNGEGVTQNDQEAFFWTRLAVAQGNAIAQFILGMKYMYGNGIIKNTPEALRLYRLSAAQGFVSAEEILKHPDMIEAAKPGQ